jgi:hypothetical protein
MIGIHQDHSEMGDRRVQSKDKLAANAADPHQYDDNEREDDYLMAVDLDYQIDYYLRHGDVEAARDVAERWRERRIEDDDWTEDDEDDYEYAWGEDEED